MKMKTQHTEIYGMQLKQSLGEIFSFNACVRKDNRSQINKLNLHLKERRTWKNQCKRTQYKTKAIVQIYLYAK